MGVDQRQQDEVRRVGGQHGVDVVVERSHGPARGRGPDAMELPRIAPDALKLSLKMPCEDVAVSQRRLLTERDGTSKRVLR